MVLKNSAHFRSTALAGSLRRRAPVPDSPTASTYNEPTVMWRMQRPDHLVMHAVIAPSAKGASVMWFVNGRLMGVKKFADWTDAIAWSDRVRDQNWTAGWRLTPDNNS